MNRLMKVITVVALAGIMSSCTDNFADVNTNPAQVNDPDIRYLFTNSIYEMGNYKYTEWFYDNYNYIWRWSQSTVFIDGNEAEYNSPGAYGGRYDQTYSLSRNLHEIRRRIDELPEDERAVRSHVRAITYIPPVYQGLRATDFYGSMPWEEAMQGRYENHFTPRYDTQQELFEQWLVELDSAIEVLLSDAGGQFNFGDQDFIYNGDFLSWARLANTLKLRIAIRLEHVDETWMQQILDEVLSSPAGIIEEHEHEMVWAPSPEYTHHAHDFWGTPSAALNYVSKLVELKDPRTHFFFEPNAFDQNAVDTFADEGRNLPDWIDPNEPVERWDRYRGGPVSPNLANQFPWYGSYTDNSGTNYPQLARVHRRLFNPDVDGGNGYWRDVWVSAAEVSLYMAELIEKGRVTGHGTAGEWYERGVRASMNAYDEIARAAQIWDYDELAVNEGQINDYLAHPDVALNGTDNMEKIYFQQYINFFRYPTELFALTRRTGFPGETGNILTWETPFSGGSELSIPRRFTVNEPSNPINIDNFHSAMSEQGWTVGSSSGSVLNQERVWWDSNSPNFGQGNFEN